MSKYPDYPYINVKMIAKSVTADGVALRTFELDYPRYIHAEVMTHRMFSRNAQSSRAVPVANTVAINSDFVRPIVYGANMPGMSSKDELQGFALVQASGTWEAEAKHSFEVSKQLAEYGLHKQWANRPTEWCSRIKVVLSATELDNFYWLREDTAAAQPEIVELASRMREVDESTEATFLWQGMWHMPYVTSNIGKDARGDFKQVFTDINGKRLSLKQALMISSSCCAQVSYRRLNESLEKAQDIYDKLFAGDRPHLSPTEHQGKAIRLHSDRRTSGITHIDMKGQAWSGNLRGFVQYRQTLA